MRVVIAEDSVLLRRGLVRLLQDAGHEIVAEVGDGPALVAAITEQRPDVSVVDVRMPPSHTDEGLRASVEARSLVPNAPILILSQYVEERYAGELIATGSAGVGYLLRIGSPTSATSWRRWSRWRRAARYSIPRSSRSSSCAAARRRSTS